ncbi:MAG: hypothetical protein IJR14_03000, partial [Synergistaceae bacterium]|nr:hypothetical protein [Synergistaceae bacterium]
RYLAAKDERLVRLAEQDLREAIPFGWPEHRVTPAAVSNILSRIDLHISSLEGDFEGAATLRWHLAGLREDWERGQPA